MVIYLAGPWKAKSHVRAARTQFFEAGISVQADWIDHHPDGVIDHDELQKQAYHDLEQIRGVDAFVVLNYEVSEGKASEFMFAYCNRVPCITVGASPNVFHHLSRVIRVDTIEEAIRAVHSLCRSTACPVMSAHGG